MQSYTYISDSGMTIQFNKTYPFYVSHADLNSVGGVFDKITPTGTDGTTTQGGLYGEKIILLEGTIVGTSLAHLSELRSQLALAMNVHYAGVLVVEIDDRIKKKIRCRPVANPDTSNKSVGMGQTFAIEFSCDRPYWEDYKTTIVPIGQIIPQWSFPFTPPVQFGYAVANVSINNNTSIEIPLRIEVMSQLTMIEITNRTTGESFKMNVLLEKDHKMIIDGNTCDIEILNLLTGKRINATNKLVAGSTYITLIPGRNDIEISNGIADSIPLSYVFYNNPSLAV